MPEIKVTRTPWNKLLTSTMAVKVDGGDAYSLVSTPPTVEFTAGVWNVSETERPGRKTISTAAGSGLRGLRFEHRVAAPNPNQNVEPLIQSLQAIAEKGVRVQFLGGDFWTMSSWWFVRSLEVREDLKTSEHRTSRATLVWECVEATPISRVVLGKGKAKEPVSSPDQEAYPTPPADNWQNTPGYTDNWERLPGYPNPRPGDNRTEF